MRTRSGNEIDPLRPLPPSNVQPPRRRVAPPPPPPPLPAGVRARQQQQHQQPTRVEGGPPVQNEARQPQQEARTAPVEQVVQQQQQQQQQVSEATIADERRQHDRDWILILQIRRDDGKPISKIGIQVTEDMNATGLAACLGQAFASVGNHVVSVPRPIAGLFIERNGLFVSLDHLLATPSLRNNTFGLTYALPPPQPPPHIPWYQETWVWIALCGPIAVGILYKLFRSYGPEIWLAIGWIAQSLYDTSIQLPLQELYRYGPWFIGWEGAALPTICARITYYGDAEFWRRNYQECSEIYQAKEEAFLRVARPTMYAMVALVLLWLLAQLLRHWRQVARYRHQRAASMAPPPEMVDTYRAIQVLLRQVRKGLEPEQPPPQSQQARRQLRGRESDNHDNRPPPFR